MNRKLNKLESRGIAEDYSIMDKSGNMCGVESHEQAHVSEKHEVPKHATMSEELRSRLHEYNAKQRTIAADKNEDMWWRSDSSMDGRELDDLDHVEDPFFDALLDDKDAQWTSKLRNGRQSDAILSCPCCFTTLCIDCQEHTEMIGHFRAMFVMNCRVDVNQRRGYEESSCEKKRTAEFQELDESKRKAFQKVEDGKKVVIERRAPQLPEESSNCKPKETCEETGAKVFCNNCGLEVAVYDNDDVYHFFNVFPSNA